MDADERAARVTKRIIKSVAKCQTDEQRKSAISGIVYSALICAERDAADHCKRELGSKLAIDNSIADMRSRGRHGIPTPRDALEVAIATKLDELHIPWVYEPRTFDYVYENRVCQYLPDFYLPDYGVYIEAKNKHGSDNRLRLKGNAVKAAGYGWAVVYRLSDLDKLDFLIITADHDIREQRAIRDSRISENRRKLIILWHNKFKLAVEELNNKPNHTEFDRLCLLAISHQLDALEKEGNDPKKGVSYINEET
jgi:hypothetical protein